MPIFILSSTANPVPPVTATSPDGILSATSYGGGVFLTAQFGTPGHPDIPETVTATNFFPAPNAISSSAFSSGATGSASTIGAGASYTDPVTGTVYTSVRATSITGVTANGIRNKNATGDLMTGLPSASPLYFQFMMNSSVAGPIKIEMKDDTNNVLQTTGFTTSPTSIAANTWTLVTGTYTPSTITAFPTSLYGMVTTTTVGATLDMTKIIVSTTPLAYFDGNTAASGSNHYRWVGTSGASQSQQYTPDQPAVGPTPLPGVTQIQFVRSSDGVPVRGGDTRVAVSAGANAFDDEAPLGASSTWIAIAEDVNGNTIATSDGVGLATPLPSDPLRQFWLKSINGSDDQQVNVRMMQPFPTPGAQSSAIVTNVYGQQLPQVAWNAGNIQPTTWTLRTETLAERDLLYSTFQAGVMILQANPAYGIYDFYCIATSWQEAYINFADNPERVITVTLQPTVAPDTTGADLEIPGHTYSVLATLPSYSNVESTYVSYEKVVSPV